jgi:hypothetical protein
MNFTTATKCLDVINATDTVERERSENRDKIARGINGFPPLSADKAKQMGLKVNISWLEETMLAKQANLQYLNAFQSQNNYFTVHIPSAPPEKQLEWEQSINRFINSPLKKSRSFAAHLDQVFSSVVAHGIGPSLWLSSDKWLPIFVPLNDFRVATDTETSLRNLSWFAIRRRYTVGELVDVVFGKYADEGWDKPSVIKVLAAYWDKNWETVDYDWSNDPERMTALIKQNISFYTSDAVPVITLWHFYHLDDASMTSGKWMMKVIPDKTCRGVESVDQLKFLFDSDEPISDCLDELLHIHFGDLNGTPPYLFHSVRSLGFLLHESCFWMNLFRCRTFQAAWESFNLLWRSADGSPKARAQFLELFHKGYVPNEVTILGQDQKNQVNQELVEFVMAQSKQLMGEASASYTQSIDTGTQKEQTLGEASIKLQQANSLMSGLLTVAARNMVFQYREICRRFCIKKSLDPDVRKFREQCKVAGIPMQFLDVSLWDVACDMPLGSGNQTLELAQASQLMSVRAAHNPDAQQEILHIFDAAVTKNPKLAQRLAPVGQKGVASDGTSWATAIFGTLMKGVMAPFKAELSPIDQVQTLLSMAASVIQRIMKTDNTGKPEDILGLSTVLGYSRELIQVLSQDPQQKSVVKNFSDALLKLNNEVKAFAQRQQHAMMAGGKNGLKENIAIAFKDLEPDTKNAVLQSIGLPPSQMPPIDPKVVKAQGQMQIAAAKHQQKSQMDAEDFQREQAREDFRTASEVHNERKKQGVKLTAEMAKILLKQAAGNKDAARKKAKEDGYTF